MHLALLCSNHCACLALLPAAFWMCLLLAFSLLGVSHCTMDATCRWSRKCLLSPSMLCLSARCIEQPDLQQPPCSLNLPFPGSISGTISATATLLSLPPSCPSVPFVHEQKFFTRTCLLCSRTLFSWLHSDQALPLMTARTDTYPHLPKSTGSVKGSADSYPPLVVSPRWPLSTWFHKDDVFSQHLEMLCLP